MRQPLFESILFGLLPDIADSTVREDIENRSFCGVADFVVETACAVAFTGYSMRTVGYIAYMSQAFEFNFNSLLVIFIVRFFDQFDGHFRF